MDRKRDKAYQSTEQGATCKSFLCKPHAARSRSGVEQGSTLYTKRYRLDTQAPLVVVNEQETMLLQTRSSGAAISSSTKERSERSMPVPAGPLADLTMGAYKC